MSVLVATSLIEVGLHVPEATVMVIENAERFGLAQLHQLRGRVGRGEGESSCLLLHAGFLTPQGSERLRLMRESDDGFALAEKDMELRGAGELLGTRQHGLPDLRIAELGRDQKILRQARKDAFRLVALDLPGFGLTGPDPTGDYSDERSVAVLVALLDRLGIGQAAVVGSSMGGRIAWRFAAAEPARVSKLVLMAPDGFASFGREYGRTPERLPWLMRLLPYTAPKPLLERTMRNAYAVQGNRLKGLPLSSE